MNDCSKWQERIVAYAYGEEDLELEKHLTDCSLCREYLTSQDALLEKINDNIPHLSDAWIQDVMHGLEQKHKVKTPTIWQSRYWILAASVLFVLFYSWNYIPSLNVEDNKTIALWSFHETLWIENQDDLEDEKYHLDAIPNTWLSPEGLSYINNGVPN